MRGPRKFSPIVVRINTDADPDEGVHLAGEAGLLGNRLQIRVHLCSSVVERLFFHRHTPACRYEPISGFPMKLCPACQQALAEGVLLCPNCGEPLPGGRQSLDEYRNLQFLREGYGSILYRAQKEGEAQPVLLRLFKPQSQMDEAKAERLRRELTELQKLSPERFVRHFAIRRSSEDQWYRVSEWIEAVSWSDLAAAGLGQDHRRCFALFAQMATALADLHESGHIIPHLILSDLIVSGDPGGALTLKVDFKLSRFLDPVLARPSPQLRRLLEKHPDIICRRPLDARSDVWSLGKVCVEILTGSEEIADYGQALDQLSLPPRLALLLRKMLASDPDQRVQSLRQVAAQFSAVTDEELQEAQRLAGERKATPTREITRLRRLVWTVAIALVLLMSGVIALQLAFGTFSRNDTKVMVQHAQRYSKSVAFVAVEYGLKHGNKTTYRQISTGTAFLVDRAGRLLSNRHVACPWLEDAAFGQAINEIKDAGGQPLFSYRMLVWFEGAQAFKQVREQFGSSELGDLFHPETAYCSDGQPRVTTVGVTQAPSRQAQLIESPLGDDVAVLQVTPPPKGLEPMPLTPRMGQLQTAKLAPVFALGFPLGIKSIPSTQVNASATMGHIRRCFHNLMQADVSLHPGNRGGPVLDRDGGVVGIASAISVDGGGLFAAPQSDLSLILPVERATNLLHALQAGQPQWDGMIDPALDAKLERIYQEAHQSRWREARRLVDAQAGMDTDLLMAAATVHYCDGDAPGARERLTKLRTIYPEFTPARFLQCLFDWRAQAANASAEAAPLLVLDWRSSDEFYGYVARVLTGKVTLPEALNGWDDRSERALLDYVVALKYEDARQYEAAENLLREALLHAEDATWPAALARSELEKLQALRLKSLTDGSERAQYLAAQSQFDLRWKAKGSLAKQLQPLFRRLAKASKPEDELALYRQLARVDPLNQNYLVAVVFACAKAGEWSKALPYANQFLARGGRASGNRLGLGLFRAQLLQLAGRGPDAAAALKAFQSTTADPWYGKLARLLRGEIAANSLAAAAGSDPTYQVTLETALGLQAEAINDKTSALRHYSQALETAQSNWMEYQLSKARIMQLREK